MAKLSKGDASNVELHPDAWERFERAAGAVAKTPPQHRVAKKKDAALQKRRLPKRKPRK